MSLLDLLLLSHPFPHCHLGTVIIAHPFSGRPRTNQLPASGEQKHRCFGWAGQGKGQHCWKSFLPLMEAQWMKRHNYFVHKTSKNERKGLRLAIFAARCNVVGCCTSSATLDGCRMFISHRPWRHWSREKSYRILPPDAIPLEIWERSLQDTSLTTVMDRLLFRHCSTGWLLKDKAWFSCCQTDLELLHSNLAGRVKRELEVLLSLLHIKHSLFALTSLNSGSCLLHNETHSTVFRCCWSKSSKADDSGNREICISAFWGAGLERRENVVKMEQVRVSWDLSPPGVSPELIWMIFCFFVCVCALINRGFDPLLIHYRIKTKQTHSFHYHSQMNQQSFQSSQPLSFGSPNCFEILELRVISHADIHSYKKFGSKF